MDKHQSLLGSRTKWHPRKPVGGCEGGGDRKTAWVEIVLSGEAQTEACQIPPERPALPVRFLRLTCLHEPRAGQDRHGARVGGPRGRRPATEGVTPPRRPPRRALERQGGRAMPKGTSFWFRRF